MKIGKLLKAGGMLAMVGGVLVCIVATGGTAINPLMVTAGFLAGALGFVAAIVGRFCD